MTSLVPKLALAGLLALSLSPKVLGSVGHEAEARSNLARAQHNEAMVSFMTRHGFERIASVPFAGMAAASGHLGECRLVLTEVSPQGWHRDILRQISPPQSQVFFVFRGRVYLDQPVWLTRPYGYWGKLIASLGFETLGTLVYGVVTSAKCDVEHLPWQELAA